MTTHARAIRPDDLEIFAQIPGLMGVVRDEELKVVWCTPNYGKLSGNNATAQDMIGTSVKDIIPDVAAEDRIKAHKAVIETNQPQHQYRLINDSRVLCTILPLDERAFGHRGVFVVVQDATHDSNLSTQITIPVLPTAKLYQLCSLTKRELEILHFVAKGMYTHEIGDRICRAEKTVEHHINAIHSKLGTNSRAELVRFASERGIQSFTDHEWDSIVTGSQTVQKESA